MKRQNLCECGGRLYMVHGVLTCSKCVKRRKHARCRVCTNLAMVDGLCLECDRTRHLWRTR